MRGVEALIRPCNNPLHACTDGSPVPHEIGPSCMASYPPPGSASFEIPLVPPSVNHYKQPGRIRGTWYITREAQAFIDAVAMIGRTAARTLPIRGMYYEVSLTVYVSKKRFLRADSDNMEKVAFDALTKAGLIKDDRYITRHTHNRVPVELANEEHTVYRIIGREEP